MAMAAGLVYVTDQSRGWHRKRSRGSFSYIDGAGRPLRDEAELARIRQLAIPPAYEDVWICADPRGHVQATGRDARGRKQYRYHAQWRLVRDSAKFERMAAFGAALPALRRRLRRDLTAVALTRTKVLATVVCLLDTTRARVGNDEYARDNGSYGLTTLRNRHVEFLRSGGLRLRFRGKGGVQNEIDVDDVQLARIVRKCHQLPGQRLFQYVEDDGEVRPVDSGQVNDYLREIAAADFTAKDFRTWSATVRAVELLAAVPIAEVLSERDARSAIVDIVRRVALDLRNTPAVCRKSYINPVVFDAWRSGLVAKTSARNDESRTLAILRAMSRADRRKVRQRRRPRDT
jgi:DNA topoisomerase I